MSKRVCHNCGKDLGEKEPYDRNLTLIDTCRVCKIALEKTWERKKLSKSQKETSRYMLAGGGSPL